MRLSKVLLIILCITSFSFGQRQLEKTLSGYTNPEELVTLAENIPFNKAIEVLSKVSENITGKNIVSTAGISDPIGIEINKMPYMKALTIIIQYNNLIYEEKENVIIVKRKDDPKAGLSEETFAEFDSKEVRISAVFFEANITDMRERGINWEFLLSKSGLKLGTNLRSFSESASDQSSSSSSASSNTQQVPLDFTINSQADFKMGDFDGSAISTLKFFENNNLGEIIARPSITVRDKNKGRIQIGSDISIKERDFAGNVIDRFYSTGTIVEVTPYIYNEDGTDYVLLKLKVERSSAQPDPLSTQINKTTAETEVLMLDGEETVIGGLFINEELEVRRGLPFFKDLPWWVFGIRYLTGYDQTAITKREILILIRTELVSSLKDRIEAKKKDVFKEELLQNRKEMENYKTKNFKEDE